MDRIDRFKRLWNKLERATEENDIDTINTTVEEIERVLCFINEEEHSKWLDQVATCMNWQALKNETFRIAKRGRNIQNDFEFLKSQIKGNGWRLESIRKYLKHLCYDDDNIEKVEQALKRNNYLRWY